MPSIALHLLSPKWRSITTNSADISWQARTQNQVTLTAQPVRQIYNELISGVLRWLKYNGFTFLPQV